MPENNEETTTEGAEPELSEQPISDQEILDVLGLDENLQPRQADKGVKEKEPKPEPVKAEEEPVSDSGENAEEGEVEEEGTEEQEQESVEAEEASKLPPKGSMQKRIDTLTARNKELQEKLEKAAPVVLQPTQRSPLSHLATEGSVKDEMQEYERMKDWCWENLNGGELTDSQGQVHELSGEEVQRRLSFADNMLNRHGPARVAFLRERERVDQAAKVVYPWLFDPASNESKIVNAFRQKFPELAESDPNYSFIMGDAICGMYARLSREQSGKSGNKVAATNGSKTPAGNPAPKLAPRPIKGGAVAPQKATQQSAQRERLHREFMTNRDKQSLEAFILSTL